MGQRSSSSSSSKFDSDDPMAQFMRRGVAALSGRRRHRLRATTMRTRSTAHASPGPRSAAESSTDCAGDDDRDPVAQLMRPGPPAEAAASAGGDDDGSAQAKLEKMFGVQKQTRPLMALQK